MTSPPVAMYPIEKTGDEFSVSFRTDEEGIESVIIKPAGARASDSRTDSIETSSGSLKEKMPKKQETVCSFLLESQLPLILAGFGLVGTGLYLDYVSKSTLFSAIPVAFSLTTPLLDLKGNLEMNFASRLATCTHTGAMKTRKDLWGLVRANAGLSQSHTITVSLAIAALCILIDFSMGGWPIVILLATAVSTASISSLFIDFCLVMVILIATRFKFNPDNVSIPLASSIGDLSTLFFFASIGWLQLFCYSNKCSFISLVTLTIFLATLPFWFWLASSHSSTRSALYTGWVTLIMSAIISGGGGYVLQKVHSRYDGYTILQPLLVGLVGNRCAIQASRLASNLHVSDLQMGKAPKGSLCKSFNPLTTFCGKDIHSKVALTMIFAAMPTQLFFAVIVLAIGGYQHMINAPFCISYLLASLFLLIVFMFFCQVIVGELCALCYVTSPNLLFFDVCWRLGLDPDYNAIPLLTSLSDLLGSLLLLLVFVSLDKYSPNSIARIMPVADVNSTTPTYALLQELNELSTYSKNPVLL
uniref:SLC41A/MgtE integral membrane domain-containing protein n=1 Tax=Ditylenchus dipsaci TaxID=166011 RepID=A0A915DE50_9BILA